MRRRNIPIRREPSYALVTGVEAETSRGRVSVDIGYGGAIYAHLRAADVGLAVEPGHVSELIAIGREVKWLLNETRYARHPADPRLSGIYGTILFDELGEDPRRRPAPAQRDDLPACHSSQKPLPQCGRATGVDTFRYRHMIAPWHERR
jgi:proline racemase